MGLSMLGVGGIVVLHAWEEDGSGTVVSESAGGGGEAKMFVYGAVDGGRCMTLGHFVVALGDTKETRWRAVASSAFVVVGFRAVEMVEGVLVGAATLTADDEILVAVAPVDGVAKVEATCALGKEGPRFPAADGDEFPEHTYVGSFHQFQTLPSWVVE